jgi:hypothetical protein
MAALSTARGTPFTAFVADVSIPGLGASDLARRAGVSFGEAASGLRSAWAEARAEARQARDFSGLDARALADLGLDRSRL